MQGNIKNITISALIMLTASAQAGPYDRYYTYDDSFHDKFYYTNTNGQDSRPEIKLKGEPDEFNTSTVATLEHNRIGENYYFATNSAKLSAKSMTMLKNVAEKINNSSISKVEINGYTDSRASYKYNKELSLKRARAVKHYLVEQGVDAGTIMINGHSESNPIASNKTAKGRSANRRVTLDTGENKMIGNTSYFIRVVND